MKQAIIRLNPPELPDTSAIGYSQISVVEPGRMAYISGQVAWRASGEPVPANLGEQMAIVSANARTALKSIGATPDNIVVARVYVVDLTPERLEALMPPLLHTFDGAQPCITGVGVSALAAPELQVELELVVRLPD